MLAADPVSAEGGWVLTDSAVLRTIDGGRTWARVTPPDAGGQDLQGALLAVRNADQAWFACTSGHSVLVAYTADGGRAWTTALVPPPRARSLYPMLTARPYPAFLAVGPLAGAYLVTSPGAAMFQQPIVLYRGGPRGTTWRQVALTGASSTGLPDQSDKNGLGVTARAGLWLTGYSPGPGTYVYHSVDAGRAWRRVELPLPPGYDRPGGFVDPFVPTFGGTDGVLPVVLEGRRLRLVVERTSDGGRSWRLGAIVREPPADAPAISFVGPRVGYMVGVKGLLTTADGGVRWQAVSGRLPAGMTSLSFATRRDGWALAGSRLWATTDGGASWRRLDPATRPASRRPARTLSP